ncbi:hypothetical protein [Nissabacter archeti]|jgi:hypothetical protein|uniref:hypothetical protein n=1 Tax=Nissabacter archeti TaxID=1917880 RepID=UPI000ADD308A|nr:hypothetical protein [Nissabacter archeti]
MARQHKDDKAAERQRWIAEGVELAISHLERSDFGEENDIRLLRELSSKLKKEMP